MTSKLKSMYNTPINSDIASESEGDKSDIDSPDEESQLEHTQLKTTTPKAPKSHQTKSQVIPNNVADIDTTSILLMANRIQETINSINTHKTSSIGKYFKQHYSGMSQLLKDIIDADRTAKAKYNETQEDLQTAQEHIRNIAEEKNTTPDTDKIVDAVDKAALQNTNQIENLSSTMNYHLQQIQEQINQITQNVQVRQQESIEPKENLNQQQQQQQNQQPQQQQQHQPQQQEPQQTNEHTEKRFRTIIVQSRGSPRIAGTEIRNKIALIKTSALVNGLKLLRFGVEVVCRTPEDAERIKREIQQDQKLNRDLTVTNKKITLQRTIMLGIPDHVEEEYLFRSVENVFRVHKSDFKVIHKRTARNPNQKNWIIYMLPSLLKEIILEGGILVGPKLCQIRPHTFVQRCRKCQNYNHSASRCDGGTFCATCGIEGHTDAECDCPASCINCKDHNKNYKTNFPTGHKASDPTCPTYREAYEEERKSLDDQYKPAQEEQDTEHVPEQTYPDPPRSNILPSDQDHQGTNNNHHHHPQQEQQANNLSHYNTVPQDATHQQAQPQYHQQYNPTQPLQTRNPRPQYNLPMPHLLYPQAEQHRRQMQMASYFYPNRAGSQGGYPYELYNY